MKSYVPLVVNLIVVWLLFMVRLYILCIPRSFKLHYEYIQHVINVHETYIKTYLTYLGFTLLRKRNKSLHLKTLLFSNIYRIQIVQNIA